MTDTFLYLFLNSPLFISHYTILKKATVKARLGLGTKPTWFELKLLLHKGYEDFGEMIYSFARLGQWSQTHSSSPPVLPVFQLSLPVSTAEAGRYQFIPNQFVLLDSTLSWNGISQLLIDWTCLIQDNQEWLGQSGGSEERVWEPLGLGMIVVMVNAS